MIHIKKDHEIEAMRLAGGVSSTVLREVAAYVKPGMSTLEIDQYGGERIRHHGGKSAFLGYRDYPCNICISVNEEVVHGLASQRRVQFGDIVSVDVGVRYEGFIGDNATTVVVGGCDPAVQRLMEVTEQALYDGLGQALAGNKVVDISRAIQRTAEANGYSIVREFVGHGVGKKSPRGSPNSQLRRWRKTLTGFEAGNDTGHRADGQPWPTARGDAGGWLDGGGPGRVAFGSF